LSQESLHDINETNTKKVKCRFCSGHYVEGTGLKNHIRAAHPSEARNLIASSYQRIEHTDGSNTEIEVEHNDNTQEPINALKSKLAKLKQNFHQILNEEHLNEESLQSSCLELHSLLKKVITALPGPKNPAVKHYERRKRAEELQQKTKKSQSKHPDRKSKAEKRKRKEKYEYEKAQFQYFNRRKKIVRKILEGENISQPSLKLEEVEKFFDEKYSITNEKTRNE